MDARGIVGILRDHIRTVVGRYRGKIAIWDVVNEAFDWDGTYKDTFWLRNLGAEYIDMAFHWARFAKVLVYVPCIRLNRGREVAKR